MANRRFEQFQLSLEKKVVTLYMRVSFGAVGAPTLVVGPLGQNFNKGIYSIVRNSAGNYTITFGALPYPSPDTYQRLLGWDYAFLETTTPAAPQSWVKNDNSAAGNIIVQFATAAGVATDPASGEVALLEITLSNSGV